MSRPCKLDSTSRTLMAKAYQAGAPCSELARHYDVSPSYVINTSKAWQIEQSMRRLKTLEKQLRQQVVPPPIEMPEPAGSPARCITVPKRYSQVKANGGGIIDAPTLVSLPWISIQHPKGD